MDSQTHREHGDHISLFSFFENKEIRLKRSATPQEVTNEDILYIRWAILIWKPEVTRHLERGSRAWD
jgi:hypothetical protein